MDEEETNFDPFEDDDIQEEEETTPEPKEEPEEEEPKEDEEEPSDEEEEPKEENEEDDSKEKMVPESRLKAAIKDLKTQLDDALQENAKLTAKPAPDRATDPDGYERHLRLEMSRDLMRKFNDDYDEVIKHYQEMAEINPTLNELVEKNELPAKFAYDLAKRDMEIRELSEVKGSDDWKEFQEWKKNKTSKKETVADSLASDMAKPLPKNLNRATSAKPKAGSSSDDDYLFGDAPIDNA